jgi:membrane-associated phospholipid phosphatase
MFQTEPILWLQAHSSPALTWLMSVVTLLGYAPTYAALVLALAFRFRMRRVLGVALALVVSVLLTEGLKDGLALPRPSDVDSRVVALGFGAPAAAASAVARGGASTFWSLPAPAAIAAVRSRPGASYGFPSGHASAAGAFVLASGVFYGWRRLALAGLVWPLLMALSRMYLGRHFLGDVLGGLAVGCVAVGAAGLLLRGPAD